LKICWIRPWKESPKGNARMIAVAKPARLVVRIRILPLVARSQRVFQPSSGGA